MPGTPWWSTVSSFSGLIRRAPPRPLEGEPETEHGDGQDPGARQREERAERRVHVFGEYRADEPAAVVQHGEPFPLDGFGHAAQITAQRRRSAGQDERGVVER